MITNLRMELFEALLVTLSTLQHSRSLCKTVLGDTSLATASAAERCAVLVSIMAAITRAPDSETDNTEVVADKLVKFSNSVAEEEKQLKSLKNVLGTQVSLLALGALCPFNAHVLIVIASKKPLLTRRRPY